MSEFGRRFGTQALPRHIMQLGDPVLVTKSNTAAVTRSTVFNRQTYIPDDKANAIFHFYDDATLGIDSSYPKGTLITHDGTVWTAIDMRRDDDGSWEVQCVAPETIA